MKSAPPLPPPHQWNNYQLYQRVRQSHSPHTPWEKSSWQCRSPGWAVSDSPTSRRPHEQKALGNASCQAELCQTVRESHSPHTPWTESSWQCQLPGWAVSDSQTVPLPTHPMDRKLLAMPVARLSCVRQSDSPTPHTPHGQKALGNASCQAELCQTVRESHSPHTPWTESSWQCQLPGWAVSDSQTVPLPTHPMDRKLLAMPVARLSCVRQSDSPTPHTPHGQKALGNASCQAELCQTVRQSHSPHTPWSESSWQCRSPGWAVWAVQTLMLQLLGAVWLWPWRGSAQSSSLSRARPPAWTSLWSCHGGLWQAAADIWPPLESPEPWKTGKEACWIISHDGDGEDEDACSADNCISLYLIVSLSLIPNTSNCLQPASSK